MKAMKVVGAVLLAAVLALSWALPVAAAPPGPAAVPLRVCLDAGHGGSDTGAVNGTLREKDLTLDIANRLSGLLLNAGLGFSVVMTRTGDVTLGNTERATICNDGRADTVLSIHLNASSDPGIDYFRAFYGKQIKDAAFARTISDTYALTTPNGVELLPKLAPTNFASGLLLKSDAPACLAETVFLTNPAEAAALGDGTGTRQQQIAQQLFNGLRAWYRV
jgi:N-acetylmuramoyl-L-alanine amidase